HAGGVKVAYKLGIAALRGFGFRRVFENVMQDVSIAFREDVEAPPPSLRSRDRRVLYPGAIGELKEIVARVDRAVHARRIETNALGEGRKAQRVQHHQYSDASEKGLVHQNLLL